MLLRPLDSCYPGYILVVQHAAVAARWLLYRWVRMAEVVGRLLPTKLTVVVQQKQQVEISTAIVAIGSWIGDTTRKRVQTAI